MPMVPFYTRFPELAARETRSVHVLQSGGDLPVGEYGFMELYCNESDCDCRRVLFQVVSPPNLRDVLAVINYGWESADFYTRWMHGDERAGHEITAASLDPINPQSPLAPALLETFRTVLMTDRDYVARLARHYEMFKASQRERPEAARSAPLVVPERSSKPLMTVPEILQQLQRVPDKADFAPYEAALRAAIEQRAAITPELIAAIDRVSANPAHCLNDHEDCLHCFAIYLLAQLRERRALDCFLRFFSLPDEQSLDLTGDMVTEQGAAVLASACGGDPAPLLKLILDESVNEFVRVQAIDGLVVQAAWGDRARAAAVEDLRRLFTLLPKPGNAYVWAGLTGAVCDLHTPELAPEARQAFTEELVDESVLDVDWLEECLFERGEQCFAEFQERNAPIDAVAECSCWLCFRDENEDAGPWDDDQEWDASSILLPDKYEAGPPPIPYVAPPKVRRNDPCPCGSGKKYKKCCGKS